MEFSEPSSAVDYPTCCVDCGGAFTEAQLVCQARKPVYPVRLCKHCQRIQEQLRHRARRSARRKSAQVWLTDGRRTECVTCLGPIEVERVRGQGGRTQRCAACAKVAKSAQATLNRQTYVADGRYRKTYDAFAATVSASTVGAISELLVCADLSRVGFDVFRAISPSASCDLVALRDGRVFRVEVKTARREASGGLSYDPPKPGLSDVVALVEPDGTLHYRPDVSVLLEKTA